MGATRGSTAPGVVYTANTAPSGWTWNVPPDALLSLLLTILLFSTARRGNGWTGVHELAEPYACRAAERPQARRIRRSEGVTCRSCSRPFVFATRRTVRRAHDGRRDRRRTIVRRRRSDPSSSCVDSRSCAGHTAVGATRRDVVATRAAVLARRPPIADGELGRLRGARRRAVAVRAVDIRLARGASLTLESHDRTRRFGSRRDGHPAHVSRMSGRGRTGSSFCSIFRGPGLAASDANQTLDSCRATGGSLEATCCARHGAGRAAVGHDAPESTLERSAASAR